MLSKLLPKDIQDIRLSFGSHPLFSAIRDACDDCCAIPQYFQFRQEYVFAEVTMLLDSLKKSKGNTDWRRLYNQILQDYRYLDPNIPKDELECIAAIICTTLASILVMSIPRLYHEIGESLLQQTFAHDNEVPRDKLYELCDRMEEHEEQLKDWFEEYIESGDLLSKAFESLFADADIKTDKGTPKHIKFVVGASPELKKECMELIQRAIDAKSNYGKAKKIKNHLVYYKNEDVLELSGTEMDIYNDLHDYYGYKQAYNTFSLAEPKLR